MALLTLTMAQAAVITNALVDAEQYRRECGSGLCTDCAASPDGACQDHLKDLDRAEAYRGVAARLAHVLTQNSAGRDVCPPRPASDQSRLGQERTMTNLTTMNGPPDGPAARAGETFTCCETPMPWPARTEDRTCPECGTVWEHDGVDLGAGARIKPQDAPATSRPGGSFELNARRTAAAAVAADFHAAMAGFQRSGPQPDYATWACRLEQHLNYLLNALDHHDGGLS